MVLSSTIVDNSGRTLSGQTIEAFYFSVKHAHASTVDINWSLGTEQMKGLCKLLS